MTKNNIEDEASVVQTIILWRIYDLLLLDLMGRDPGMAAKVAAMHEKGEFVGPNPSFSKDNLDDEDPADD